jgi:hypothetical protein
MAPDLPWAVPFALGIAFCFQVRIIGGLTTSILAAAVILLPAAVDRTQDEIVHCATWVDGD